MVFIRAPIIERTGPAVEILASLQGQPVLVRQGRMLIATFHPELTKDTTVHEYFVRIATEPDPMQDGRTDRLAGNAVT